MRRQLVRWWQEGIIYHVYPLSFRDRNGDGFGDLRGIRDSLDYLDWLGVSAIWLSPIYESPLRDFGYDVSDYRRINPMFGTFDDFDGLLNDAHDLGIKLVMDFVPNHTSDRHPWFIESRSSSDNPKRDWYIWRDAEPDGSPPNNWVSHFGGPAWEWDEDTGQYYYHAFLKEQPDLNWRNPEVHTEMMDTLKFWLARGVDGFRMDVLYEIIKDDQFRDDPPNPNWQPQMGPHQQLLHVFSSDRPEVHEIVRDMREVLDRYGEAVMIGEIWLPLEQLVTYYGNDRDGTHLPLNFQLLMLPWQATVIKDAIRTYEDLLPSGGWPNWVLGNHDTKRVASRIGPAQARVAAMMLLTLRGTPTMYYGDEIGMQDVPISPDSVRDQFERNVPGLGLGRDPARTPMQWNREPNAGFSADTPWLPVPDTYTEFNVQAELDDPHSILSLYHSLIELRHRRPALAIGRYEEYPSKGNVLAWLRIVDGDGDGSRLIIALNLGGEPQSLNLNDLCCRVVLTTEGAHPDVQVRGQLLLGGNQGLVAEIVD